MRLCLMDGRNDNLNFLDVLTVLSLLLQVKGYQNDLNQSSNDDLMRELQKQDREYLQKIIENQNKILEKLAELGWFQRGRRGKSIPFWF